MPPPGADGEIRALTGLRIVAALWVVAIHFQFVLGDVFGGYLDLVRPLILSGWIGVDLFFVLSGYVMAHTYLTRMGPRWRWRSTGTFLWARLARIWPLWAVLTVAFYGVYRIADLHQTGPLRYQVSLHPTALLQQLALVQMWTRWDNPGASLIAPGWSLSVEFLAYLCFPVLVLVLWRLRRLPVFLLAALSVASVSPVALLALHTGESDWHLPWPLRIAGAFIGGALAQLVVRRLADRPAVVRSAPVVAAAATVETVALCYWSIGGTAAGRPDVTGVVVVCLPVLVASLALSRTGLARVLSRPAFVLGGRISFALYLVHFIVLDLGHRLQEHVPRLAPGTALGTLLELQLIPAAVIAAYLLWRFVEEPARVFLRRVVAGGAAGARRPAAGLAPEEGRTAPDDECPTDRLRAVAAVSGTAVPPPRAVHGRPASTAPEPPRQPVVTGSSRRA